MGWKAGQSHHLVHVFKGPCGCCVQSIDSLGAKVEHGDQTRGCFRSPGERRVAGARVVTVEIKVDRFWYL